MSVRESPQRRRAAAAPPKGAPVVVQSAAALPEGADGASHEPYTTYTSHGTDGTPTAEEAPKIAEAAPTYGACRPATPAEAAEEDSPKPKRGGESPAHRRLKTLALFWAQKEGYAAGAYEITPPNSRFRADLAAYRAGSAMRREPDPKNATHRLMRRPCLGRTAIFECKASRSDFLKDSHAVEKTRVRLRELHARRTALELALRVHYPSLRQGDTLFPECDTHDFSGLQHENLRKVLGEMERLQRRLFDHVKFDTLRAWRAASLFYVVADPGVLEPPEVPVGWGLLVRHGDALELKLRPVLQDCAEHDRLALLVRIATAGMRALNRAEGISFEDVWEARQRGA